MALNSDTDIMSADDSFKVSFFSLHSLSPNTSFHYYDLHGLKHFSSLQVVKRMNKVRNVKLCTSLFTVINNRTNCVVLQVIVIVFAVFFPHYGLC
jgi:hypothetical protein